PLFAPGNGFHRIYLSPGRFSFEESEEVRGNADLCPLERGQKEAGLPINLFGDKMLFLAFEVDRLFNDRHGGFQKGRRCLNEFIMMDRTVAIFGKFLEDMTDASLRTNDGIPGNPESLG